MSAKREVRLPIRDKDGVDRGSVHIAVLPRVKPDEEILWDYRHAPDKDPTLEEVQILEHQEYRFKIKLREALQPGETVSTSHKDVLEPSVDAGTEGRLRPRLHVGILTVQVYVGGRPIGSFALEVRSAKFNYLKHYRWMLQEIAEEFSEFLMERFAASEQRFQLGDGDAATLYQRFAFLKHLIAGDQFEAAMQQIVGRPHRAWVHQEELRRPGQRIPGAGDLARRIVSAPGPRATRPGSAIPLPIQIPVQTSVETLDTPENRFVKFALTRWRDIALDIERALLQEKESSPVARGRQEVRVVRERLDALLSAGLFAEVGRMTHIPANSQVLQKRAGYREILRASVQFEAAASLAWKGGENVYQAGQRNVAALYEYWVFMRLRGMVASLCEDRLQEDSLFDTSSGLTVTLKRGEQLTLRGHITRYGRRMTLDLYYNHWFETGEGSWTMAMQPDCSLLISPGEGNQVPFDEVWIHFDAKYRIDNLAAIFGAKETGEAAKIKAGTAKRDDLLKMHAYRDAIRKSAGSYVIYPGSGKEGEEEEPNESPFRMYHELLPGLGAFALRPAESGKPYGFHALRDFISDVIDHVASQATQYERGRYWEGQVYDKRSLAPRRVPGAAFLGQPPADTVVLLGYVKSKEQFDWIDEQGLYNVRASAEDRRHGAVLPGSQELAAKLVVLYEPRLRVVKLYGVHGNPIITTKRDMVALGYPDPRGDAYYCLQVEEVPRVQWPENLTLDHIRVVRDRVRPHAMFSLPIATSWLELVR